MHLYGTDLNAFPQLIVERFTVLTVDRLIVPAADFEWIQFNASQIGSLAQNRRHANGFDGIDLSWILNRKKNVG